MELVDLKSVRDRRKRQAHNSSFREPLLWDGAISNEESSVFLPSDAPNRSYRPNRLSGSAGNLLDSFLGSNGQAVVPPTGIQTYQPPRTVNGVIINDDVSGRYNPRVPELYFSGPQPPSIMRAVRRQTPGRTVSMSRSFRSDTHLSTQTSNKTKDFHMLKQSNPAKDLGGVFSYGFFCCQCVRTQEVGIMEDMGRFQELLGPGLHFMLWPFSDVSGRLSLRTQQLDIVCETKTKDNVFVHIAVSVLYKVILEKAYDAYYRLTDPSVQIRSYVFDVIRSTVPNLTLDDLFSSKSSIANKVLESVHDEMHDYGYEIKETLVTDISPDPLVKASMNEINASRRLKEAMAHRAESEKTQTIKGAEAAAEASYLSGVGMARQRMAIARGMQECVLDFSSKDQVRPDDAMTILLISHYLDTLAVISANDIIIRHDPGEAFRMRRGLESELPCTSLQTNLIPDLLS